MNSKVEASELGKLVWGQQILPRLGLGAFRLVLLILVLIHPFALMPGAMAAETNEITSSPETNLITSSTGIRWDSLSSTQWGSLTQEDYATLLGALLGIVVVILLLVKIIMWFLPKKSTSAQSHELAASTESGKSASQLAAKKVKQPSQCNVVSVLPGQRKLWRFAISGRGKASLVNEFTELPEENLPDKIVGKGWGQLWNPKLNIAWLASDKVFFRVAEFPAGDRDELLSMVELQLEKLSPLPLSQIIWAVEMLPSSRSGDGMQPVVLIIAVRAEVEKYLGRLENTGYLADRIEVPELQQLLAAHKPDDGVWFLPRGTAENPSLLIAWWYGGTLKNLTIANLTESARWEIELGDQLAQVAWSGELEGWYSGQPHFHLLADTSQAERWKPVLEKVTGEPVTVDEPLTLGELAGLDAKAAAAGVPVANLMPVDIAERYRQRFIDAIWMRGLGTVLMVYAFAVLIYFLGLEWFKVERNKLKVEIHELTGPYNKALMAKARIELLQEQIALKYAALESLRAVSAQLPEGMVLISFDFSKGRKISLRGTVAVEDIANVSRFQKDLSNLKVDGDPLFKNVTPPRISGQSGSQAWSFSAELNSSEI